VWGTCVDLFAEYLYVCRSLAEVESIKAAKRRLCVYKRAFLRLLTSYCFTNTHGKVVVVRQNVCGVPVWTCIRDISMFAGVWRKLTASKQRKVDCVGINVLFCDF
jgi:hypothetical protein